MALAIGFVSVIVRKSAIERKFPGGLDGFARQDLSNFLEDDHLVRVGFMSGRDAFQFIDELEAAGLRFAEDENESDIAVITACDQPPCPWLIVGVHQECRACWLTDHPPGDLVDFDPSMLLKCPRSLYHCTLRDFLTLERRKPPRK